MERDAHDGETAGDEERSTIFVSVPSYRDKETPKTLQHLFRKAKYPGRIVVMVNEQNDRAVRFGNMGAADASATQFPGSGQYMQQIRLLQKDASEAEGPVVARALIEQELYTPGEADYWLQIDSHTAFTRTWDVNLIRQHNSLKRPETGILTTFPSDYNPATRAVPDLSLPNYIGFHDFNSNRLLPTQQRYQYRTFPDASRESLFFAGGFSFCPAEIVERVPYDPQLRYVFLGEEISMAARFFTHGYDLFNPTSMIAYHLSNRSYRPTFWEQLHAKNAKAPAKLRAERKMVEQTAIERVQRMLFHGDSGASHGLGRERTLEQFQNHIGVDFKNQRATPRSKLGMVADAPEREWIEKHGVGQAQWAQALRNLSPLLPPKQLPQTNW